MKCTVFTTLIYVYSVPELNDKLMMLERIFILPKGLPFRPFNRHALFSPAANNLYGKLRAGNF